MVLCSVLIHGLSIPFFSLGRRVTTVTRTWSRQPSLPDWALHTRRVDRAEDVVINRDPANMMERGHAGAKDGPSTEPSASVGPGDEKRDSTVLREDSADGDALTVAVTETEEAKADNAPDGTEVFAEWKEGPHRIIERRTGPGEEVCFCIFVALMLLLNEMPQVEVEVQSNAYGQSEAERITRAFRGGHAAVHRAADSFIGGMMRHVPHEVEAGLKGVLGSRAGDDVSVPPHQRPYLQSAASHTPEGRTTLLAHESAHAVSNLSAEPETASVRQEEEEDGWVSDPSWPEDVPLEKGHQQTAKPLRSRSNKRKRTDRHRSSGHVHHHSRLPFHAAIDISTSTPKSSSASASGSSTPAPNVPSLPSPTDTADEEPRGRRMPGSGPSTSAIQTLPRHMRIMSLRGSETASREVSPVRSVRWADAGAGASPATMRWPQSPSAQGSRAPSPGPSSPGEPMEPDLG